MKLKIFLTILIVQIILLFTSCSSNVNADRTAQKLPAVLNSQAEKDFKNIDSLKSYFCDYPKECERYENSTFLEKRRFEEKVDKNRVQLALTFLKSYPNDPRYYEVLKFFFNMNFEPRFVTEKISDSLTAFLSIENKSKTKSYYQQLRALPIDVNARNKWLEKGQELAAKFLKSNAPLEQKIEIEIALLGRDFRLALRQYKSLDIQKKGVEADYWKQFDKHYWESFRLRMVGLIDKYSEFEIMATYMEQLIALVAKFSPHLVKPYWEDFLQITDVNHPCFNHKGVRAVHERAKANLKALKNVDDSKPLEMAFTAIDGTKINLANMRGKVVLIDFWTVRCAPCIKEMPHAQAMYDKYRSQGFEVIGLVGDDDTAKEQVLKIIKKQSASWPQYLDKGKDAIVSYHSLYNIRSYPTVWLLNKEGIIVDKNARGVRLEPLIRLHLGLDK